MLPANRRLTTEFFNKVISDGRLFHSIFLTAKIVPMVILEKTSQKSRFSVVAAKKFFKTAVSRNRARRRVYDAIAPILSRISDGFFVIVMVKPDISKLTHIELISATEDIFIKARIMKIMKKTDSKVQ